MQRDNAKRLLKDVRSLYKDGLEDQGIYYKHDDENMTIGYALIIGPQNTPYQYGFYLFKFDFPDTYPYNPPKLTFLNQFNNIRFHPNLYRNGKVCISILNTWHGEKWSSCQTIKTILLTLCMILTENPLLHEPGIKETHEDINRYNSIVNYSNFRYNIYEIVNNIINKNYNSKFNDIIIKKMIENLNDINKLLKNNKKNNSVQLMFTTIYSLHCKIDYNELQKIMKKLGTQILKQKEEEQQEEDDENNEEDKTNDKEENIINQEEQINVQDEIKAKVKKRTKSKKIK